MARGPRDWSPRLTFVWVVFVDTEHGNNIKVFKKERDAYGYAVGVIVGWLSHFEDDESGKIRSLIRQGKDKEAVDFYMDLVDENAMEKMPLYSIDEFEVE